MQVYAHFWTLTETLITVELNQPINQSTNIRLMLTSSS